MSLQETQAIVQDMFVRIGKCTIKGDNRNKRHNIYVELVAVEHEQMEWGNRRRIG